MTAAWAAAALVPAIVCAIAIALLRRSSMTRVLYDVPNERSLHDAPRPRVGGIGVLAGALPAAFYFCDPALTVSLALALALAAVSLMDDRRSLPIAARLSAHLAAATAAALLYAAGWVPVLAAVFAVAWMTNLFNFMDGADGLAGGMGVIGFATLSAAAAIVGDAPLALSCACLASACIGFLAHNFPPAKVFLGDAGSVPLGFLAGALGLAGVARHAWPWWFPLLAFAPFIFDATLTLARRAVRGEKFWRAHRTHAYQRLVLAGWSHRRLALWSYLLMALSAACALLALRAGGFERSVIISTWTAALALLFAALELRLPRIASPSLPRQEP